jgi:CRP/FNR family transcriptional regulator, cyclic AMP receptor protein
VCTRGPIQRPWPRLRSDRLAANPPSRSSRSRAPSCLKTRGMKPVYSERAMKLSPVDAVHVSPSSNIRPIRFEADKPSIEAGDRDAKKPTGSSPFDLFQWLSTDAQQAFVVAARRRSICDNCRIYTQAERGNEMFRIVSGSVRMSVLRHDGREALHSVLQPGDCFGICSMLDDEPRHHTTTANGNVELQVLRRDVCERLRTQHPSFADALFRHMSRHTRLLIDYFVSSTLDELACRVAMRLLKAQKPLAIGGAPNRLTVDLSQGELALMVGASRQAVNKVLQKFQEEGLISIEYGCVQVLDVARLQSLI